MKTRNLLAVGCATLVLGISAGRVTTHTQSAAQPERKASSQTALPAAVEAAFKKAYPKAIIKNVSKEEGNYEIESMDGSQARDLMYRQDGTLISYEEAISEADVPPAVVAAVKTRYPKATITTFERVCNGKRVSYEVVAKQAGRNLELELSEDAKWLSPKPTK